MTDQPNVATDIAEALATESPQASTLQTRVRRGGALARAAVLELATAPAGSQPQRVRLRAAVLAADACADDSVLRALLGDAAEDPASPLLSDLLAEVAVMARADGPAATLLADAAVTADLLAAAIEARPDDPRIADAVLEALGDSSGFRMAPRPVRSRENAAKVTRNGIVLLERSTDDTVRHRLEQVLLARLTPAGSASNDEVLHAVLATPSGRGPELIEDLARAGAPGIQRQAARVLGRPVEEAALPAPVAGETIAIRREDVGRWTRAEDIADASSHEVESVPESAPLPDQSEPLPDQSVPGQSEPEQGQSDKRTPRRRRWWGRLFRPKR